ncbi:MmgE/PrpD family protein [Cupriavidus taiwanensis]|uniref:MmgE/PrpD family protein n=2 Tax=Cupriavidus taiwanensis TaxID=164546 RepID=A0A375CRA0_9BURK|nr:MmgE/PrpD family protein [Cupriavidus taiwanensis]
MPKDNEQQSSADMMPSNSRDIGLHLGRYVADLDARTIDARTQETVLRCVLDAIASAASALEQPGVKAAQQAAQTMYGAGSSPMWFTGRTATDAGALFANSAASAALDLDDGYRKARGHPGAATIPAALALVHTRPDIAVQDFMAAVVAGYEVGIRMAMARPGYAPSGTWSGFAVVATCGRMLGASAEIIAQALAIAAQTAPALPALAGLVGSDVKEGIAAGAVSGWAALELAMAGYAGPAAVLKDGRLFDSDTALRDLGGQPLINGTYFKPFGCCRHIHAPLDALLHLQRLHGLAARDIKRMEVHTYRATFNLTNKPDPETLVEAQYSVPYCLALCALHGADALLPLDTRRLYDAEVSDLAKRITVVHDVAIESLFPARSPAWVAVTLSNGQLLESPLTDPRGDPHHPLSWGDLERKLQVATRATLSPASQQGVLEGMAGLRAGAWNPLLLALSAPARTP